MIEYWQIVTPLAALWIVCVVGLFWGLNKMGVRND